MRHRKTGKKLGRSTSHRKAMLRNMVTSLFRHEQLETTDTKAKALKPVAEKMLTLAKRGDLHARRQALARMGDKAVTHKLFDELKDRFVNRQGGYVRIIKKGIRRGDSASVSVIQLLPLEEAKGAEKKKGKKSKATKARRARSKKQEEAQKPSSDAAKVKKAASEKTKGEKKGQGRSADQGKAVKAGKPGKKKKVEDK